MARHDLREDRTEQLWILVFCGAVVFWSFVLEPSPDGSLSFIVPGLGKEVLLPPICMSRGLLGITCPGCGLTRSFVAAAHGEFLSAIQMNPMGPVLFFLCCLQIPYRVIEYTGILRGFRGWNLLRQAMYPVMWILLGGLTATWIWRIL